MIRRPPRSTPLYSSAASDVYKRQDWICVSPKENINLVQTYGDELKLVFPQKTIKPRDFEKLNFKNFLLQPMDGPEIKNNTINARKYCNNNNNWKLSLQTHKILGYP